jgi:hypothetical protein
MDQTLKFASCLFPRIRAAVGPGDERTAYFRRDPRLASVPKDPDFVRILDSIETHRKS